MRGISISVILVLTLLASACTAGRATEDGRASTSSTTSTTRATTTTTLPPRVCDPDPGDPGALDPADGVAVSVAVSRATFPCADEVILAPLGEGTPTVEAANRAIEVGGPVLLVDGSVRGDVAAEIRRLAPERVSLVGLPDLPRDLLAAYELIELTSIPRTEPDPIRSEDPARVWVVDHESRHLWPVVWTAATLAGDSAIRTEGDLRAMDPDDLHTLDAGDPTRTHLVSDLPDASWQLEVVMSGRELPGGGHLLFPGRRLVALYGNPGTAALGVLGEQDPVEGTERLAALSEPYAADGIPVVPTFEIIATIASSLAGADGDYSAEMGVDDLRPWVDAAAELGVYVVLDLQPGRSDFLSQARAYESLLREPHVGLALDPEWRLGPSQIHLRQIGTVDATEINAVAEWLAGIVREEALPQKLFLLHQFRFTMITHRDDIVTPTELAVVIQMDGQGPLPTKYETWEALTAGTEDAGWMWGWKNFFHEDAPMATPEQVLDLDPVPVYVSFQ